MFLTLDSWKCFKVWQSGKGSKKLVFFLGKVFEKVKDFFVKDLVLSTKFEVLRGREGRVKAFYIFILKDYWKAKICLWTTLFWIKIMNVFHENRESVSSSKKAGGEAKSLFVFAKGLWKIETFLCEKFGIERKIQNFDKESQKALILFERLLKNKDLFVKTCFGIKIPKLRLIQICERV